jgi:mycoredoxin
MDGADVITGILPGAADNRVADCGEDSAGRVALHLSTSNYYSTTSQEARLMPHGDVIALTMYSTSWCGYCRRLKSQLDREGIDYTEVDIEVQPEAADFVMKVNNGNQTVPTVLFPDGSAATNPSIAEVKARLAAA